MLSVDQVFEIRQKYSDFQDFRMNGRSSRSAEIARAAMNYSVQRSRLYSHLPVPRDFIHKMRNFPECDTVMNGGEVLPPPCQLRIQENFFVMQNTVLKSLLSAELLSPWPVQ